MARSARGSAKLEGRWLLIGEVASSTAWRDGSVLVLLAAMAFVVREGVARWWRTGLRVPLDLFRDARRRLARRG